MLCLDIKTKACTYISFEMPFVISSHITWGLVLKDKAENESPKIITKR